MVTRSVQGSVQQRGFCFTSVCVNVWSGERDIPFGMIKSGGSTQPIINVDLDARICYRKKMEKFFSGFTDFSRIFFPLLILCKSFSKPHIVSAGRGFVRTQKALLLPGVLLTREPAPTPPSLLCVL